MKAAAALIRSEIYAIQVDRDTYPNINELGDKEKHEDFVPASLLLLSEIYLGKKTDNNPKITSIGHYYAACQTMKSEKSTIKKPLWNRDNLCYIRKEIMCKPAISTCCVGL